MKKLALVSTLTIVLSVFQFALAQEQEKKTNVEDLFNMSLDDFLDIEIVSASKFDESARKTPATTLVITHEEIKAYAYKDLNEIVENIPGFYSIDDLAYNGPVAGVRGYWSGNSRNIIILVNGIKSFDNYSSGYRLRDNPIPVEAIDRIEVIRGPLSVIYGSGAFFGVINIVTNETDRSLVSASAGSLNSKKLFFRTADNTSEKFKYSFNASTFKTDGLNKDLNQMGTNISNDYPQTTDGRLENRETYFNFSSSFNGFTFDASYFENPKEIYFFNPSASDGYLNRQTGLRFAAGFNKKIWEKWSLNGRAVYNKQVLRAEADYFDKDYYGKENIETEGMEAELNVLFAANDRLSITAGVNYRAITDVYDPFDHPRLLGNQYVPGVSNTITRLGDGNSIVTFSGFSQLSYDILENLHFVAGIGFEKNFGYDMIRINGGGSADNNDYQELKGRYEQEKIAVFPRLALIYSPNNKQNLKLLYGEAINSPSFQQNWTQFVFETYSKPLEPEHIKTLELNYSSSPFHFLNMSLSLFRNKLDQLITRTHGFDNEGNYITFNSNAGEMTTNGMEAIINADIIKNFKTEISFTYQKTKNNSPGYENIEKAYSPNFLGYMKVSYKINNIVLGLTGNYVDEMQPYWDITIQEQNGLYGARIGEKTDAYYRFSANVNFDNLFNKGVFLNCKLYNIFDEEIRYPTFTNNRWADKGTLGLGRMFIATAGWNF